MNVSTAQNKRTNNVAQLLFAIAFSIWFFISSSATTKAETICNPNVTVSNIRKGPSSKTYAVQDEIANGQNVEVLDRITNDEGTVYLKIRFDGSKIGYIYSKFVSNNCNLSTSSSPFKAPDGYCYFVLASRKTSSEVSSFTNAYSSFQGQFQIYKAKNNWNIITIGTISKSQFKSKKEGYLRNDSIPDDALCSAGKEFASKWNSNDTVSEPKNAPVSATEEDVEYYLIELITALNNNDHLKATAIYMVLDEMEIEKPKTFDFHFGLSLLAIGEYSHSARRIENFIKNTDGDSLFHSNALKYIGRIQERAREEEAQAEMIQQIKQEADRIEKENAREEAHRQKYGKWHMPVKEVAAHLENDTRQKNGDIYLLSNESRNNSISGGANNGSGRLNLVISCFASSRPSYENYNDRIDLYIIDGGSYGQNLRSGDEIKMKIDGRTVNLPWILARKDRGESVETGLYRQFTSVTQLLLRNLITAEKLQIYYPLEGNQLGIYNFDLAGMYNAAGAQARNCGWR